MKGDLKRYDTSDYPQDNIFGIPRVNKKIPGLFKDELNSLIITEFVGLRSKMYSLKAGEVKKINDFNGIERIQKARGSEKMKKAKGVKGYVLKKQIVFDDYVDCIHNNSVIVRNQNTIRAKKHNIYSIQQQKVALSPFDNKRFILENNIDTLPWGHYKLQSFE